MAGLNAGVAFRPALFVAVALIGGCAAGPVTTPRDEANFTAGVADRLRAALPGSTVTVSGPLTLDLAQPTGTRGQVNLDRVWAFCGRNTERCQAVTDDFIRRIASEGFQPPAAVERSMLRAVIRPADQLAQQARISPVQAPFLAGMMIVCMVDRPSTATVLSTRTLPELGLTAEEAIELGKRNAVGALRPLSAVTQQVPPGTIGVIQGDFYESSRLLLHRDWEGIAGHMRGPLIVSAPAVNVILYADAADPHAVAAMQAAALETARRSDRPLSTAVLQWSPAGWRSAAP